MSEVSKQVLLRGHVAAPAELVWSVLRDFTHNWHPAIEWMKPEQGGVVRCFKAKGDDAVYRERLRYMSDTERTFSYIHLEGIKGISAYRGECHVISAAFGCDVEWRAEFSAPEPRALEVEQGTRAILEGALQALVSMFAVEQVVVPGSPVLGITHTTKRPGPLVLFLHGIGGNRGNWLRQLQAVAPFAQATALDLRGYGQSALGPNQSRVDDYCDDILRVMSHFNKDKCILVGLSYGSWIATSFAMRFVEKLSGLVLSGGCTGMSEACADERAAFLASRQRPLDEDKTPADFAPAVVNVIAGPHASEQNRGELLAAMSAIPSATYRDAVWCFTHPEEVFDFARLSCPILMMTGEQDRMAPPSEIRNVAARIASASPLVNVRFEIIAGAGHVCNIEQPNTYNHHLTQFIKTHL